MTKQEVLQPLKGDPGTYVTSLAVEVSGKVYCVTEPKRFHTEPTDDQRVQALYVAKRRVMQWIELELFGSVS